MNVIYYLDNSSMSYGIFCSSSDDMRAGVCSENAPFNLFIRNIGNRSTQVYTSELQVNKNWYRACAVVAYDERHLPIMPYNPLTTCACELKWTIKYLLLRKVYDHKTWQGSDLPWAELTHDVTWSSDHVVALGHVTNWKL